MNFFGITTRVPSFGEITAASVMALGLWLAAIALMSRIGGPVEAVDAGALLLVIEWACVAVRMGIRPDRGTRDLVANMAVSAALLGVYFGIWGLVA